MLKHFQIADKFNRNNRVVLFEGDTHDLLKSLPDKVIQLIVTSPPYNIGKEYETKVALETYIESQKEIISELVRVLADDGSICWQVGNFIENGEVFPLDIYFYRLFQDYGLKLRNRIIWHFGHGLHAKKRFSGRYETILWFTKSDKYVFNLDDVRVRSKYPGKKHSKGTKKGKLSGNPKGKNPSDFWDLICEEWEASLIQIPNVKANHVEKTTHPCQFPVELIERLVLALTNEGDWILDPYAGVGSSLIAGLKNNRKSLGAERQKKYIKIAKNRLKLVAQDALPMRPLGQKIYKPKTTERVAAIPARWNKKNSIYYQPR